MKDFSKEIRAYALRNAIAHEGKAIAGSVLTPLFVFGLKKEQIKDVMPKINEIVKEVNSLGLEKQKAEFEKVKGIISERETRSEDELPQLEGVDKKKGVIMRFAPSPSGPLHIGHAATGMPSAIYVKKYGGKFYIRIEDTNPENIDPAAYDMIPEESTWLFGKNTVVIQSDRMKMYYECAEELIKKNSAYVCSCESESFKKLVDESKACPCRNFSSKENLARWKKMLDKKGYKEGEVVLRFKSDLKDPNPAMRDFPLARINEAKHPRTENKYRVWPLMNLSVTVDDVKMGVTHTIRAKEHRDNAKRQEMMMKVLGKKAPVSYFLGRYNFTDLEISCSKTKAKIKEGVYSGWDDIRLPFIAALRKRGFVPGAFEKMALRRGMHEVDKVLTQEDYFRLLGEFNAEIIGKNFARANFSIQKKKAKDSAEILMDDGKTIYGKSDIVLSKLKEGNIVYFAGIGYCRYNPKEKIRFWFAHR